MGVSLELPSSLDHSMQIAPKPANEAERLEALASYQVYGTGSEPAFDRITSLASKTLDIPTSLIALVGEEGQWLKSVHNFPGIRETSRDVSFCAHTILGDDAMVVPDAALDPRFSDNPLVVGGPQIRFYAGMPLRTLSGHNVGSLCVVDTKPREATPEMVETLRDLATMVVDQFEFRERLIDEATRQKEKAETNYKRLAEAVPGMVFRGRKTGDAELEYLYVGPGSMELMGIPPEDFVEKRFAIAARIHPDDLQGFNDAVSSSWRHNAPYIWTGRVTTAKDELKWVRVSARSERLADGTIINEGMWYDVTEGKRRELALSEAKDAAERANLAKSEFLSRMSHELRTPLNAILGFAQILALEPLDGEAKEDLSQLKKAGEHLLMLINEVLDLAAVDARKVSMSIQPVRLDHLLSETVSLLRPLIESQGVRMSALPQDAGAYVMADRQRLKQIVINLLSNAAKYNRKDGGIDVRLTQTEDAVSIEVRDEGMGIAPEKLERLFRPFERLGAEGTKIEGTGLGLSISRGLVELMGGSLSVSSVVDEGSTFSLRLPRAENPTPVFTTSPDDTPALSNRIAKRDLLYIEDNESNVLLMQRMLRQRPEVRLTVVKTLEAGRRRLAEAAPDLLLLDMNLPDGSGEAVVRWVRDESPFPNLPIVVLSADATPRQIEAVLAAGADHYLTKPLDMNHFLRTLDKTMAEGTR